MAAQPHRIDDLRFGIDGAAGAQTGRIDGQNRLIEIYNVGTPGAVNFEKLQVAWATNFARLQVLVGGTGVSRQILIQTNDGSGLLLSDNGRAQALGAAGGAWGLTHLSDGIGLFFNGRINSETVPSISVGNDSFGTPFGAAAGTQTEFSVAAAINQSGTAGFSLINGILTETSVGSGQRRLLDLRIGATVAFVVTSEGAAASGGANYGFRTTSQFGTGVGVLGIANAVTNPSTNPTGGGILYADAGAGKWRGSGGTVTTFGPAEPHCPDCGRDCALEWENTRDKWKLALCMWCITEKLGLLVGQVGGGVIEKRQGA